MEPKKKAEELVKKFLYGFKGTWSDGIDTRLSKQCVLIAVEEISKELIECNADDSFIEYWQKVKQELEKL